MKNLICAVIAAVGGVFAGMADVSSGAYVQDGLIAQWDAIDNVGTGVHDPDATTWKDLVGTRDLPLLDGKASFADGDKLVIVSSSGYSVGPAAACTNYRTLEWAGAENTAGKFAFLAGSSGRVIIFENGGVAAVMASTSYKKIPPLPTTFAVTYDENNVFSYWAGGTNLTVQTSSDGWGAGSIASGVVIGGRHATETSPYSGKINAIRLYSRELTAAEMKYNEAVDRIRFQGTDAAAEFAALEEMPSGVRWNAELGKLEFHITVSCNSGTLSVTEGWYADGDDVTVTWTKANSDSEVRWIGLPADAVLSNNDRTVTFKARSAFSFAMASYIPQTFTTDLYVRNGLLHFWDGISNATNGEGKLVHDSSATTWRDFVTGDETALATMAAQGDYWTDDAYVLNTTSSQFRFAPNGVGGRFMLEFLETGNSGTMIDSSTDNIWWKWNNGIKFKWRNDTRINLTVAWKAGEPLAIASEPTWFGIAQGTSTWSTYSHTLGSSTFTASLYLGGSGGGDVPTAGTKCKFVRIYDHMLTIEERQLNYAIDQVRYGGVSAETAFDGIPGFRWNPTFGALETKVDVAVYGGSGTASFDGLTDTEGWCVVGKTYEIGFVADDGSEFDQWADLPEGATVSGEGKAVLTVTAPISLTAKCVFPELLALDFSALATSSPRLGYTLSRPAAAMKICYGVDPEALSHTNEFADVAASGSVTLDAVDGRGTIYVKVLLGDGTSWDESELSEGAVRDAYYVTPDAEGGGNGLGWETAMTIAEAVAAAADGDEIRCRAGEYTVASDIAIAKPILITGGYAGTDAESLDGTDPSSVFNAAGSSAVSTVFNVTTASGGNVFERIGFREGKDNGMRKSGAGALTLRDCDFLWNGTNAANTSYNYGKGLRVTAGSAITLERCAFRHNAQFVTYNQSGRPGSGLSLSGCGAVTIRDSEFFGNGQRLQICNSGCTSSNPLGDVGITGSAICSTVPVAIYGTKFVANSANTRENWTSGGSVWLAAGSAGSIISNCLFVANYDNLCWSSYGKYGGVVINAQNQSDVFTVDQCTFAYNLSDIGTGAAGITVAKGTLNLRNSVFGGNMIGVNAALHGRDLNLKAGTTCNLAYSVFGEERENAIHVDLAATLNEGNDVVFADPCFVTTNATVQQLVRANGSYRYFDPELSTYDALEAIDVHLVSSAEVYSPAIDAADPGLSVGLEPVPNGGRRNAGWFGGSSEAARSIVSAATTSAADVVFDFAEDTMPIVTVTNRGDGVYNATVTIEVFDEDPRENPSAVPVQHAVHYAQQPGNVCSLHGTLYLIAGSTAYVRVTTAVKGGDTVSIVKSATVTGSRPAYAGHGGPANVIHVRGGASGLRNGTDWADACATMTEALTIAVSDPSKTEIWVMGTVEAEVQSTVAFAPAAAELVIRGGFTGTEDALSDRADDGSRSRLDGLKTYDDFLLANASGHNVTIERLDIVNMVVNGLNKTGAGNLTIYDCSFQTNGYQSSSGASWTAKDHPGKALRVTSAGGATITVSNCLFRANRQETTAAGSAAVAIHLAAGAKAVFRDCDIIGSCMRLFHGNQSSGGVIGDKFPQGSAIYTAIPLDIRGCRFSANIGNIRSTSTSGGTLWFASGSSGSIVSNCAFYGNWDRACWNKGAMQGGCIVLNLGAKAQTVDVDQCSFGFNLADGTDCAAGITVVQGTLNLRNSVFGGNLDCNDSSNDSNDLCVKDNGIANVSYTVFGGPKEHQVYVTQTGTLNEGFGVTYNDPLFVSPMSMFTNSVIYYTGQNYSIQWPIEENSYRTMEAFDLHLLSNAGYRTNNAPAGVWLEADGHNSPAIDAADPELSVLDEPDGANGNRRNAGYYGGSAEASKTYQSVIPLGVENVAVDYPDGYSRPRLSFTVTGDPGCVIDLLVTYGEQGQTTTTEPLNGCIAGETCTLLLPLYYAKGTTITVHFAGNSSAGPVVELDSPFEVTTERPVWYGHGGGAKVLHCWKDAPGTGDGSDWNNACRDWNELVAVYKDSEGIEEIWFIDLAKGTESTKTMNVATNLVLRGGFAYTDDSPADRVPGAKSVLDAKLTYDFCSFNNTAGTLTAERLVFTQAAHHGFYKSGAGNLVMRDCEFVANRRGTDESVDGSGLYAGGDSAVTTVVITNCLFAGNGYNSGYRVGRGVGAFFNALKTAEVSDTLFVTNGTGIGSIGGLPKDSSQGSAIFANSAVMTIRRCQFLSNCGTAREPNQSGGQLRFEGDCDGSRVENCLFTGGEDMLGWSSQWGIHGGAVVVKMTSSAHTVDLVNCTIAYNLGDGLNSPGGLNVYRGTVNAKNTIFYGNFVNAYGKAHDTGADIDVKAEGVFNADYCLFTELSTNSISCRAGGVTNIAATCIAGDPGFVTPLSEVEAKVSKGAESWGFTANEANRVWLATSINVHLRGRAGYIDEKTGRHVWMRGVRGIDAAALDAGDPASSVANEADYDGLGSHGRRVNLGAFGGTPWATMTPLKGGTLRIR